jgi:hypothetical protein
MSVFVPDFQVFEIPEFYIKLFHSKEHTHTVRAGQTNVMGLTVMGDCLHEIQVKNLKAILMPQSK